MSAIYDSKIISKLYKSDISEVNNVMKEILEIPNPVFLYPLLDIFRKFPNSCNAAITDCLETIESPEVLEIVRLIIENDKFNFTYLSFYIDVLLKFNYFPEEILNIISTIVFEYIGFLKLPEKKLFIIEIRGQPKSLNPTDYDLSKFLKYLTASGKFDDLLRKNAQELLLDRSIDNTIKEVFLYSLLRIKPYDKGLTFLTTNFNEFKTTEFDITIAKEMDRWKGKKKDEVEALILEKGSERAQEIVKARIKIKEEEIIATTKDSTNSYASNIILELNDKIKSINLVSTVLFSRPTLPENGILELIKIPTEEEAFKGQVIFIREYLNKIDLPNCPFDEETAKSLLPFIETIDINKPINKLFFFLNSNGIEVDENIYGLRQYLQLISLLAAHSDETDALIKVLQKNKLLTYYTDRKWDILYLELITRFKKIVDNLSKNIKEFSDKKNN